VNRKIHLFLFLPPSLNSKCLRASFTARDPSGGQNSESANRRDNYQKQIEFVPNKVIRRSEKVETTFCEGAWGRAIRNWGGPSEGMGRPLHQPQCVHIHDYVGARYFLSFRLSEHGTQHFIQFLAAGRFQDEVITVIAFQSFDRSRSRA
jgi:hypothetical protein